MTGHDATGDAMNGGYTMSAERMFTLGGKRLTAGETAQMYARGWLLTHLVMTDPARARQFSAYLEKLAGGTPPRDAATAAFGDLRRFDIVLNT